MRVRLTINVGTQDAERFDLPATRDGSEFDVPDHVAETLVLRGWATAAKREQPTQLHAVPSVEIQADDLEPEPEPEPEAVEDDEPDGGDEAPDHDTSDGTPRRRRGRPRTKAR